MTKRIADVLREMVDERNEVLFLLLLAVLLGLSMYHGPEWMSGTEFGGAAVLLYGALLTAKGVKADG